MALGAWATGGVTAFVAGRHVKRLERFVCPGATVLVERARKAAAEAPPSSRDAAVLLELELMRDEARRTLSLATLVPRGMARVALASGTALAALALAGYGRDGVIPATVAASAAFVGGLFGSAVAAQFGRRANSVASAQRSEWKRALSAAERELEREE